MVQETGNGCAGVLSGEDEIGGRGALPQRAVAIRALGWRLRFLVTRRRPPCESLSIDRVNGRSGTVAATAYLATPG